MWKIQGFDGLIYISNRVTSMALSHQDGRGSLGKTNTNLVIITVPVDGLAPLGARPFAGTTMTKFNFSRCTGPAFECQLIWLSMSFVLFPKVLYNILMPIQGAVIMDKSVLTHTSVHLW